MNNYYNLRTASLLSVAFFSFIFFVQFVLLSSGNIFNNYPYITPDGFDWYAEGAYLYHQVFSTNDFPLQVLRPPIFVILCSLDYAFGGQGIILGLIYSLNILILYNYLCKFINLFNNLQENDFLYLILAYSVTFMPINFIRPYLLADEIAITLAFVSSFYLIIGVNECFYKKFMLGGFLALLGGLTQTYALIPLFIILTFILLRYIFYKIIINKFFIYYSLFIGVTFLIITFIWRGYLPHLSTPENFTLFSLDLKMLDFYSSAWSFYFFPFLCFKLFNLNTSIKNGLESNKLILFTIFLTFSVLSFLYHWPEARFISYYWYWALIVFFSFLNFSLLQKKLLFLIFIVSSVITPLNYWTPLWVNSSLKVSSTWFYLYFQNKSIPREIVNCFLVDCKNNTFINNSDSYVKSSIDIFNKIEKNKYLKN